MLQISFLGYKPITRHISMDFYTGEFVNKEDRSIEHIVPKSKGGRNNPINYAMVSKHINSLRGNMDLDVWLKLHSEYLDNMKRYIKKYWNFKIKNKSHGQEVAKTVLKAYNINLLG